MDEFEQQIKRAMARREAPPWFEARVLAATERARQPRTAWRLRWVTAAVASLFAVTGVVWQHQRAEQERAEGEAAKAKLELALKITRAKLLHIEQEIEAVQSNN